MNPSGLDMDKGQLMRSPKVTIPTLPTVTCPKPCHLRAICAVVWCPLARSLGWDGNGSTFFFSSAESVLGDHDLLR